MKHPKIFLALILCICSQIVFSQQEKQISTIDFVQIVDNNREEALFYYEYNWKVLRIMAMKKQYITSFEIIETPYAEEAPFHLMLITTYANKEQYAKREAHFQELIKESGELRLLNDKKPAVFRKNIFHKENATHLSKELMIRKG